MESFLEFARGPMFWGCLAFMVLGLLRHAFLTIWSVTWMYRRAGDRNVAWRRVWKQTLEWLLPFRKARHRPLLSATTMVFHISIVLVPIFLAGHVVLWRRGIGFGWPSLPNLLADILTVAAVVTAFLIILQRATSRTARKLSRPQDYILPVMITIPFISGFLIRYPTLSPAPFEVTLLVHVLSANVLFVAVPLTKISHILLFGAMQVMSEVAWHFPPDADEPIAVALGKENEPI